MRGILNFIPVAVLLVLIFGVFRTINFFIKRKKVDNSTEKEILIWLFFFYILTIINLTLFPFAYFLRDYHVINLIPFKSISELITTQPISFIFKNLVGNVILFVPLAFLMKRIIINIKKRTVLIVGFFISVLIEFTQYITFSNRVTDIDDIILNCLGVVIGVVTAKRKFTTLRHILPKWR